MPSFFTAPQFSYIIRRLRSHGSETMRDDFGNSLRIIEIKFEVGLNMKSGWTSPTAGRQRGFEIHHRRS